MAEGAGTKRHRWRSAASGMKRLSIEQCNGSCPARRSGFNFVWKTSNGEAVSRELFEVTKLFHVTVGDFASGLVSLPDNRRIAIFQPTFAGVHKRCIPSPGVYPGDADAPRSQIESG